MKENDCIKLANIQFPEPDTQANCFELFFRAPELSFTLGDEFLSLTSNCANFCTYFNGLSTIKWQEYCCLSSFRLSLRLRGSGQLSVVGYRGSDDESCLLIKKMPFSSAFFEEFSVDFNADNFDFIGFIISPDLSSSVQLKSGFYSAHIGNRAPRKIKIALCSTTFKKERYITKNVKKLESFLTLESDLSSDCFHMFVVDNGRTLQPEQLNSAFITVVPNENVGGSGGFARGMLEAMRFDSAFTHFVLMDDDVSILPESFFRLFSLLSLAGDEYKDAFVNGAMLSLSEPFRQFEDVASVSSTGILCKSKPDYDLRSLNDVLSNESAPINLPRSYGGWWFSAFPVRSVKKNGLPLPFFIRCDDVEFGIRNKPLFMTMSGICVWHESFEGRFRPSVDCYQYFRNFFVMNTVDDCVSPDIFLRRFCRSIRQNLRDFDYNSAELSLDALEDFLKGPDFLENIDGSLLMQKNSKRNDVYLPIDSFDPSLLIEAGVDECVLSRRVYQVKRNILKSLIRSLPYDRHYLPNCCLSSRPHYVVKFGTTTLEGSTAFSRKLVVLNATRDSATIRQIDKARFKSIRKREHLLLSRYRSEIKNVSLSWKQAFSYMTSAEFWESYLGLS